MTENWRSLAACRDAPDLWFLDSFRTSAVHICRAHCPVVEECHAWAATVVIAGGVAGGIAHDDKGRVNTRNGHGAAAQVCGPSCLPYRQHFRDRQEE